MYIISIICLEKIHVTMTMKILVKRTIAQEDRVLDPDALAVILILLLTIVKNAKTVRTVKTVKMVDMD